MRDIISIFDLEAAARKRLPRVIFEYVHGGAEEQIALRRNRDDLAALALSQRSMIDVSERNTSVTMVGDHARIPLAVGPTGLAGLAWVNGECEAAKAAAEFGVPYCLSVMSICTIEDVAQATLAPFWFQLYLMKDHEVNERLIRRAHDAGCSALVLTVDLHVQGKRWADVKNGLSVPPKLTLSNTIDFATHARWLLSMIKTRHRTFGNLKDEIENADDVKELAQWIEEQFDPSFDIETVKWVRKLWKRKLILKGIMHVQDARQAADIGADAIVVSNHGGRQLDTAPSSISVLPQIAEAVGDQIEVFFDGGIRTGADIVKAMGRGADACLSGRGCLYGLAANGAEGVKCALTLFEDELNDCMALVGVKDVRCVPPDMVLTYRAPPAPDIHARASP